MGYLHKARQRSVVVLSEEDRKKAKHGEASCQSLKEAGNRLITNQVMAGRIATTVTVASMKPDSDARHQVVMRQVYNNTIKYLLIIKM